MVVASQLYHTVYHSFSMFHTFSAYVALVSHTAFCHMVMFFFNLFPYFSKSLLPEGSNKQAWTEPLINQGFESSIPRKVILKYKTHNQFY